ncbi:MAG: hypothetical protein PHP59_08540 [Methanofollis sp.]|uniref:hypothetical protein n=1 Tax=Methanofollis sp. TaxID=2052835 RepID=UPI002631CABC|nr:hypothetical protein [Methanofollis sp.]MDD4255407.1 hypothetical protein [Methanofollis sp.]
MKNRTRYLLWTAFGVLLLLLGIAGVVTGREDETVTGMFITSGIIVLLFAGTRAMRGEKGPEQDERTRKIGAYGITYAWFLTLVYLFALFWLENTGVLALSSTDVMLSSILLTTISATVFQWWLFRKGDVE